jgi:hypothetical protein
VSVLLIFKLSDAWPTEILQTNTIEICPNVVFSH